MALSDDVVERLRAWAKRRVAEAPAYDEKRVKELRRLIHPRVPRPLPDSRASANDAQRDSEGG